jgi:GT2 family glycosyltransferase
MKKIAIIIVNYNKYEDTIACVNSLLAIKDIIYIVDIIIVDNCSTNCSYDLLKKTFPYPYIHLLQANENKGYCAGNNIGIIYAKNNLCPDYYWILNPDTLIEVNALTALLKFAEIHKDAGLIGSKLVYYPDTDKLQALGGGFIRITRKGLIIFPHLFHYENSSRALPEHIQLDLLIGASMFIRKEVVDMIGLMDESYFMYCDETEYCIRAKRKGWNIYAISNSIVWHKEGWRSENQKIWSIYYSTRNYLYFVQKYYKKYFVFNLAYQIYECVRDICTHFFRQRSNNYCRLKLKGIVDFCLRRKGKVNLQKYL